MLGKANIKDVCALVDIKANSEDLDRNLKSLHQEIKMLKSPPVGDFRQLKDQKAINDAFRALNCLGIWLWHGGFSRASKQRTVSRQLTFDQGSFGPDKGGSSEHVRWSREIINTDQDQYLMDEDGVLLSTAGLYEISFTFFVPPDHPRPSIQLRVNEKAVLSTVDAGAGPIVYP